MYPLSTRAVPCLGVGSVPIQSYWPTAAEDPESHQPLARLGGHKVKEFGRAYCRACDERAGRPLSRHGRCAVSVGGSEVRELDAWRARWKDDQSGAGRWRCSCRVQSTECNGRPEEGEQDDGQNQRAGGVRQALSRGVAIASHACQHGAQVLEMRFGWSIHTCHALTHMAKLFYG